MVAVHPQMDPRMGMPTGTEERNGLAMEGVNHRVIPDENMGMESSAPPHESVEEHAQLLGCGRRTVLLGNQSNPAVKIPAQNEYGFTRLFHGLGERGKVSGTVDKKFHAPGAPDLPAVSSFLKNLSIHFPQILAD